MSGWLFIYGEDILSMQPRRPGSNILIVASLQLFIAAVNVVIAFKLTFLLGKVNIGTLEWSRSLFQGYIKL